MFAFENLQDPEDPERLGQILQELVITDLSGHDALDILSSQRLFDLHRQIAGGASRIDRSMFTEVATQARASAMLTGTLSRLGERWILASQIVDLASGKVTTSQRIDGDDLFRMVDDLTGRIYSDLAPAEAAPVADVAVAERTSSSLPAHQLYLEGVELLSQRKYDKAEAKLQEALRLDPNFGQARLRLAIASWWAGDQGGGGEVPKDLLVPLMDGTLKVSERDQMLARGMFPILGKRYAEGEPLLQRMTERYPDDKDAWYGLGEARWHKSPPDLEGATAALKRALELDPAFLPAFTHLEKYYTDMRHFGEAIGVYRGLIRTDPAHLFWYTSLLKVLIARGDEDDAKQLIQETLARFPSDEDRLSVWRRASTHYESFGGVGNRVRALECQTEMLAIDPTNAEAMANLAHIYLRLDDWEEAERWLRRAEEASVDDSELAQVNLIRTFKALEEGRTADAVRLTEERAELRPERASAPFSRFMLIQSYLRNGQPTEAARVVESALDSAGSVGARQALLAWFGPAYHAGGEPQQAVDLVLRGIAMEGGEEHGWLVDDLVQPYIELGRYDDAEAAARRTLELVPRVLRNGEVALVDLDMLRGNPAGAEQRLRSILRDGPVTSALRTKLALSLAEQGRYEEAEADARWVFARSPDHLQHVVLAWVLIAGGRNVDEGTELAEKAMSMPRSVSLKRNMRTLPFLPSREHALGLGYLKQKRYEDAVRLLEQAAELQPGRELIAQHLAEAKRSM